MSKFKVVWFSVILLSLIALITFSGSIMSWVEEPKYIVVKKIENIEIREYPPMLLAEIEVTGSRSDATGYGFKKLASYIFGENSTKEKISMMTPVLQKSTIHPDKWYISFVMPSLYKMKILPIPDDPNIKINQIAKRKVIVIRFSGFTSNNNIEKHIEIFDKFVKNQNLKTVGKPIFAFYNPPWTLPFLKRNEIMIELQE